MITKNTIKYIQALQQKKNRLTHNEFVVEGVKMVNELKGSEITVNAVYTTDVLKTEGLNNVIEIKEKELQRISSLKSPNIVLAVCAIPTIEFNVELLNHKLTLVLDDIKDPGNLGTIIRIADWFGIKNIICSEKTVDCYNPKVVQSTMGSIARVNVFYKNLASIFSEINDIPVFGTVMDGASVYKVEKTNQGIIVIGNESKGISTEVEKYVTNRITIPSIGQAESLNAAVATGIICSHFRT